jgi:hypothetical protein
MILEGVEGILILSNDDEMYDEIASRFSRATGPASLAQSNRHSALNSNYSPTIRDCVGIKAPLRLADVFPVHHLNRTTEPAQPPGNGYRKPESPASDAAVLALRRGHLGLALEVRCGIAEDRASP